MSYKNVVLGELQAVFFWATFAVLIKLSRR